MKTLISFFALISLSLPSFAGIDYGGWEFENYAPNFSISVPPGAILTSKSGNCFVERTNSYAGTWNLSLNEQNGNIRNEVASLLFDPSGHLLIQTGAGALRSCGDKNEVSTEKSASGNTLKVKCSGNPFAGEGSGKIEIKSGPNKQLLSISVEYNYGWYQSFDSGRISCKF